MKRGHTLSQASITELRRAIADVASLKASIRQETLRGSLIRSGAPHYVVETPTGGIPAASGDPLQPGSATCKLYWREGDPKTLTNTNRDQTVYNLSTSAVAGGVFVLAHRDAYGDMWVDGGESTGGSDTVIVIARATADVTATDKTFSAKIKATIAGTPQTFDETITVENLAPGDFTTPTVSGNYIPTTTDNVFLLLEGMNFIAVKSNTDSVSWPYLSAEKTGWFILQAPGVFT